MNANRIVQMVLRQVMRRLIGRGINAGIDRATRGKRGDDAAQGPPPGGRDRARKTKKALRLARRFGRF
ncbi:hypothetical protein [Rhodosalinus sediminis]|uniref:hypothetical protein n=1 Tax=Rhodosalinus sediminis TaxID=1940533 RepID=UPI002354D4F4|nr:hypothetical protein [Rhodosalinus sediminis]